MAAIDVHCPLCSSSARHFHRDKDRAYYRCGNCLLVFVQPEDFLSAEDEKAVYDLHRNTPDDLGYRKFLSRIRDPIARIIPAGGRGLDFGSGPGPTLSVMFEELGYLMAIYDPIYATDESVLESEYDFVTATEVAEHLRIPRQSLDRMWRCVRSGGYLGIMSKRVIDRNAFANWRYKDDDTHICFFSVETFKWLAGQWGTEAAFLGKDVVLFQKTTQANNPLHGITLEQIVTFLVAHYGWPRLGERIRIRCFTSNPSVRSSLKFLRKTPWARKKVETLYLSTRKKLGT